MADEHKTPVAPGQGPAAPAPENLTNGIDSCKPLTSILFPENSAPAPGGPGPGLDDEPSPADLCSYYSWTLADLQGTHPTSWYQLFSEWTFPSVILPLQPDVVNYLQDELVHLPRGVASSGLAAAGEQEPDESREAEDFFEEDSDVDETGENALREIHIGGWDPAGGEGLNNNNEEAEAGDSGSGDDEETRVPLRAQTKTIEPFESLDAAISEVIKSYNGSVFPKLNWKSPKDAAWIAMNKSLRSYVPGDIYLLFKSSTRISSMWDEDKEFFQNCKNYPTSLSGAGAASGITSYDLILRQWTDIHPASEFRCFVINRRLVGISQREITASYSSILEGRNGIMDDIFEFYKTIVAPRIESLGLTHFVFDVVRSAPKKVVLVDLNVFDPVHADGCLFSYAELKVLYDGTGSGKDGTPGAAAGNTTALANSHLSGDTGDCTSESTSAGATGTTGTAASSGDDSTTTAAIHGLPTFRFIDSDRMVVASPYLGAGPIQDARHCIASGLSLQQLTDEYSTKSSR